MYLPLKRHSLPRVRTDMTSVKLKNALKIHLVPKILKECQTVSVRCVFEYVTNAEVVQQIAARRRQLEMKLLELDEVRNLDNVYYHITFYSECLLH